MKDLAEHRIPGLPPTAYYIPSFISEAEEEYLLRKVRCRHSSFVRASHRPGLSITDRGVPSAKMENSRDW